jgi:hypothetical protein
MLLKLPGELRDMIIDHVLLTPLPVPSHDFITYSPRTYGTITPSSRFPSTYSTQPLLHTNHQLRAETTLRASKLDIPLVLDICCWIDVSCRKNSRCVLTWLNQRWGEPATWGRITAYGYTHPRLAHRFRAPARRWHASRGSGAAARRRAGPRGEHGSASCAETNMHCFIGTAPYRNCTPCEFDPTHTHQLRRRCA